MMHPTVELVQIDERTGRGLRATQLISQGTIVWARDELDLTVSPERLSQLDDDYREILRTWAYLDERGDYVLCWDNGRFVNHSCNANVFNPGFEFEIAVRDILPGEQITNDYCSLNLEYTFACACGLPECRGTIQLADLTTLAPHWDRQVTEAYRKLHSGPQPLWKYVRDKDAAESAWSALSLQPSASLRPYQRLAGKLFGELLADSVTGSGVSEH